MYNSSICEEKIGRGQIAECKCYIIYPVHVPTVGAAPNQCTSQYKTHDTCELSHDGAHVEVY